MTVDEVAGHLTGTVVVTGGEPLLQQGALAQLAQLTEGVRYEVETNGTVAPRFDAAFYMVSPKLAHAGDQLKDRIKHDALKRFTELAHDGRAAFKFVCQSESDLSQVAALQAELGLSNDAVWIMPEGATMSTHLTNMASIADSVVSMGWNLTTRIHVLAWGTRRGV